MLPKIIAYQDYKKIDNANFHDDVNDFAFDQFDVTSRKQYLMFDERAPIKQKYL